MQTIRRGREILGETGQSGINHFRIFRDKQVRVIWDENELIIFGPRKG